MKSPVKNWSDAKFKGWIVALLRKGTMRFPPRNEALKDARTEKKINTKTGRLAQHYKCAGCGGEFTSTNIVADHIEPVVDPVGGFITWDTYITRMFCPKENFQAICKECHDAKSAEERQQRKAKRNMVKDYD